MFRHLSTLGPAFFERTHSAEMMSRLTADTTLMKSAAGTALSQALRNAIMLVGALVMMFVTSVKLSLLVLVAIPLIVFPLMGYGRAVRRLSRRAQDTLAEASAYAAENLSAVRTMQAFTYERTAADRFSAAVEHSFAAARDRLKARAGLTGVVILLVVSSIVGVLWYGASAVVDQEMTGGRLGQFVLYALFAGGALAELSEVWGEVQQAAGAAERLSELMAAVPEVRSPANPKPLPRRRAGEIAFRDVTFTYPIARSAGARLAVVQGRAGRDRGPGRPFGRRQEHGVEPHPAVLRSAVRPHRDRRRRHPRGRSRGGARLASSLVPQDVALFADTVAENIRYGTPGRRSSPRSSTPRGWRRPTASSARCPRATTRSSASAG